MLKHISQIRIHAQEYILIALIFLWSLVWDINRYTDFQRTGRIKLFLGVAAAIAAFRFAKVWHPLVGLIFFYLSASYLYFGLTPWALPVADKILSYTSEGGIAILCITATLFLIPEIYRHVSNGMIALATTTAAALHSILGIINVFGIYPYFEMRSGYELDQMLPIGLLGHPTVLGPFLCFALGFSLVNAIETKGNKQIAFTVNSVLILTAILLTKSSMTYASLAAALFVIIYFYRPFVEVLGLIVIAIMLGLIAIYLFPFLGESSGRMLAWNDALLLHGFRPWFGYGLGAWEPIARGLGQIRQQLPWTYTHSEPIQGLMELGRVGMVLIGIFILIVVEKIHALRMQKDLMIIPFAAGFAALAVNSLANFTFHLIPHGPIAALCVYIILKRKA